MQYKTVNNRLLFVLLTISLDVCTGYGQQTKAKPNDSAKVYKNIENFSNKSKFRKSVYKLFFRPAKPSITAKRKKVSAIDRKYHIHEGKIIRKIIIETLDPFGFSSENKNMAPETGFERFGNIAHIKSKNWTIKNHLLFKKNEPLDSLLLKESERLIRSRKYIRSVVIQPATIPNNPDSVDVYIRALDSWSLIPTGAITENQGNFELTERNFFGLGHEVENNFIRRFSDQENAYNFRYNIINIKNSYINSSFRYNTSLTEDITKSIKVERRFFSPLTRFAGGIFFENRAFKDSLPDTQNNFKTIDFQDENFEVWFGHSVQLFKGKSVDLRTTNLVSTIGFRRWNHLKKPDELYDPSRYFSNEEWLLGSIGISTRKFIQDKYLFNFNIIEDIPYGKVYSITTGFQNKNYAKRAYLGARFSYGFYYSFGYIGANVEWGSLFDTGRNQETTFKIDGIYFTPLLHIGKWKWRQFINSNLVIGSNRADIIKDRIALTEQNGFAGFKNPLFNGTRKYILSFQTQTYAPGNWNGFHFSPFTNISLGFLGDESNTLFSEKLYSKFSLGLLINNDYLVFNSFQISFSYYPTIPFEGNSIFKSNTLKNNDLTIPNYEIGQPSIVGYK
jgi:hypothetical protein